MTAEMYFYNEPDPRPAGVEAGWLVVWSGGPGPGSVVPVAMVTDGQHGGFIEPTGQFQPVTITDDAPGEGAS